MCSHSMSIFSDFEHAWKSKPYVGLASPFDTNWPLFEPTHQWRPKDHIYEVHFWWDHESILQRMNDTATNYESEKANELMQKVFTRRIERMRENKYGQLFYNITGAG